MPYFSACDSDPFNDDTATSYSSYSENEEEIIECKEVDGEVTIPAFSTNKKIDFC